MGIGKLSPLDMQHIEAALTQVRDEIVEAAIKLVIDGWPKGSRGAGQALVEAIRRLRIEDKRTSRKGRNEPRDLRKL